MKRIYDFSRNPAHRNYTISDLQALKETGRLSMANPANNEEVQACLMQGLTFVVGGDQIEDVAVLRQLTSPVWAAWASLAQMKKSSLMLLR